SDETCAAVHPGAGPGTDVAEHDRPPRGHVLEGEPLDVGAVDDATAGVVDVLFGLTGKDHVRPRKPDAEARGGRPLDVELAALGAVGEGLPDRAVQPLAVRPLALEDRDLAAEHRLADAVLSTALDPQRDPIGVERAEALAGH